MKVELGNNKKFIVQIDEEDFEKVDGRNWYLIKGRPATWLNGANTYLHRIIMNVYDGEVEVDHIFHNPLDCRKSQLRVCTPKQNSKNRKPITGSSSKYVGVGWDKRCNKWYASIRVDYKLKHIGLFTDEIEAAKARDIVAKKEYGEFAYLNFP